MRTKQSTRRFRVGVVSLEPYRIQRGDIATVAMNGDARVGELAYVETGHYIGGARGVPRYLSSRRWFAFLCDQDDCPSYFKPESGICLRHDPHQCEGQHGAEPYKQPPKGTHRGDVLVAIYGRVVAVERDGAAVETLLTLRELDPREQASTFIEPRKRSPRKQRPQPKSNVVRLAPVAKRIGALTTAQHEEIARLIKSSMDSTAKNRKPELTYEGRIVVRREVTTLARVAGVRRLQSHHTTFRRALAKFENQIASGDLCLADQRAGRLAIEHLWRWLHGYVKPIEPRYFHGTKTPNPAARQSEELSATQDAADGDTAQIIAFPIEQKSRTRGTGAIPSADTRVLPFKRPGEELMGALVRIRSAPDAGVFRLISMQLKDSCFNEPLLVACGSVPVSCLEWVGPKRADWDDRI